MEENNYIKWLEDTLYQALNEIKYAYETFGYHSTWAENIERQLKKKELKNKLIYYEEGCRKEE